MSAGSVRGTISLADLVALNDEIAALARAGVPLDLGLIALGRDWPGRTGRAAQMVGERLAQGESLEQIFATSNSAGLPQAYTAVVAAGVRAGRLPSALEGIAHALRRGDELRSVLTRSMIYPLLVLVIAYQLFLFWVMKIAPVMAAGYEYWEAPGTWFPELVRVLTSTAPYWRWAVPIVFALWVAWSWYRVSRMASGVDAHPWFGGGVVGLFHRMRLAGDHAVLADLLAVLLEHGVPLHESLALASHAMTSRALQRRLEQQSEQLARGEPLTAEAAALPPSITCALLTSSPDKTSQTLRRVGRMYHDNASRRARWISTYLPILFVAGISATAVVLYALLSIVPWLLILQQISRAA